MKKTIWLLLACCMATLVACNDYETYGDKKEKERKAIRRFIADSAIVVIDEATFRKNNCTTDTEKNEFVYLDNTGVYMQIVDQGCGTPLQDGENCDLLIRFLEISLLDSTSLYNDTSPYDVDVMNIRKTGSTITANFTQGLMYSTYASGYVPSGWLVPFSYINVGRPRSATDRIAKVRLIVPHSKGHNIAINYVYPYYYEITFQRKIDL